MSKKITVKLSEKAAKYFALVQYGLPKNPDGSGIATNSQVINESLETLAEFEQLTENQLSNWLQDFKQLDENNKKFVANPVVAIPLQVVTDKKIVIMENNIPRRIRLDLSEPAELAIRNAVNEVEKIGADVRLTKAVNLLHEARELVADFIDEQFLKQK